MKTSLSEIEHHLKQLDLTKEYMALEKERDELKIELGRIRSLLGDCSGEVAKLNEKIVILEKALRKCNEDLATARAPPKEPDPPKRRLSLMEFAERARVRAHNSGVPS